MLQTKRRGLSSWSSVFLISITLSAIVNLAFLGYIFGRFEADLKTPAANMPETRAIPTYLALFIFGEAYEIVLALDGIFNKNTFEVIGICIFNLALLLYAGLQYPQIRNAVGILTKKSYYNENSDWKVMSAFLIAIPCVTALCQAFISIVGYKLYAEFGWQTYKTVGADLQLKRRYLAYLTYIALLKFDFFFFLGFTVQFVVIVLNIKDVEFALTLAVIPVTIGILWLGYWCVRNEHRLVTVGIIGLYFAGMAYFCFKLVRMYTPSQAAKYAATRKSLTTFAVITIILLAATIGNAIWCCLNFNRGLKQIIDDDKSWSETDDKVPLTHIETNSNYAIRSREGSRMDID